MKKWLIVLFAAAAMTAWAQEEDEEGDSSSWKITGEVKSGFEAKITKDNKFLKPWNDDAKAPLRADLQLERAGENSGVSIRLRAEGFSGDEAKDHLYSSLGHAYGWVSFLEKKIELSGGLLDNAKWGTLTSFHIDDSLDNRNGVKLEIKPIEGLSLGANFLYALDDPFNAGTTKLEDGLNEPVFGVKYVVDSFGVAAEFVLKSTTYNAIWTKNTSTLDADGLENGGAETKFGTLFSAYFNGMEDKLSLELDGTFASFKDFNTYESPSLLGVSAQALFHVTEMITPGLQVDFGRVGYKSNDNAQGVMDIVFTPKVGVTLNPTIGVSLEAGIKLLDMRSGDGNDDWKSGFGFNVKPKATFSVTPNATLVLFYNLDNAKEGYSGSTAPDAVVTHTIQLDMIWKF
jgi:hypothetical protein